VNRRDIIAVVGVLSFYLMMASFVALALFAVWDVDVMMKPAVTTVILAAAVFLTCSIADGQ
jgi:hypothetical protein